MQTQFTDLVTLVQASWLNDVDAGTYNKLSAVGGTNTITATGPTTVTVYAANQWFIFTPAATNTGATTLNISAIGAKSVFFNGAACLGGELKISVPVIVQYDGTQFNIIGNGVRPGLNLIGTAVASASATVDFTSGITSAYDEYLVTITDLVPATDNTNLVMRVSEDAGATFKAGAADYRWAVYGFTDNATSSVSGSGGDTSMQIRSGVGNTATSDTFSAEVRFFAPSGTSRNKAFSWQVTHHRAAVTGLVGAGKFALDANAINGIRFLMSSGNITSGNFALYGIRKS